MLICYLFTFLGEMFVQVFSPVLIQLFFFSEILLTHHWLIILYKIHIHYISTSLYTIASSL